MPGRAVHTRSGQPIPAISLSTELPELDQLSQREDLNTQDKKETAVTAVSSEETPLSRAETIAQSDPLAADTANRSNPLDAETAPLEPSSTDNREGSSQSASDSGAAVDEGVPETEVTAKVASDQPVIQLKSPSSLNDHLEGMS